MRRRAKPAKVEARAKRPLVRKAPTQGAARVHELEQRLGVLIGAIVIWRTEVRPFTQKQIDLATTFADQAVIAIENVRLFKELEARTAQLTGSVEKLKALSEVSQAVSSTLDLETVLATIVSRAVQLSASHSGIVYEFDETLQSFHARATHRISPEHLKALRATPIRLGEGAVGRAGVVREPVEVSVSDTGVGIALEDQEAVFEEFRQVGTAEKKAEGTGPGLTLCRKFIELHGGRIWVKSQGAGSTFTFTIPVRHD